jgi:glycosyltransferase involved in cell wall biosynthesis
MAFHIVLPRQMQLSIAEERAASRLEPRHAMGVLAKKLDATVHEPMTQPASLADRVRSFVIPPSDLWILAREVLRTSSRNDVVFCTSEAGGLQLAATCARQSSRPRLAVFVHNVDRPRARFALKRWHMMETIDLFLACSPVQADFLRSYLKLPEQRVRHVWDHTDTQFFLPGAASTNKKRPIIVSVGLEQRDYKTLAAATFDLDVDVRISGFSKDAASMSRTFPAVLPENMSRRFYDWTELVQLYRDADLVVVSCHENNYAAGVQSVMEALACRRPVVATATNGLSAYLDSSILITPPGNVSAMRRAVQITLSDRVAAEERASRGYRLAEKRYSLDEYVREVEQILRSLAG